MLLLAGLLLHLLAFGTLVAPVFTLQFNFTNVQQCAPIVLSFTGLTSTISGEPASLEILPFNSTVVVIPLQNITFSMGIGLNFLPFAAGSQFIASLDDVDGNNIIDISDIIPVLPSPNNNSTCVPNPGGVLPRSFTLASPMVSQCQNFTISYNTTMVSKAPSVRLYSPTGPSFLLKTTSDDPISGVATYTMAFSYGHGIVLLMDDGSGIKETTSLLIVEGDSSSPTACLSAQSIGTLSSGTSSGISSLTSRIIAISGATVGGVGVLLGACLAVFVLRDHRRRRRAQHIQFERTDFEEGLHNEKGIVPQVIVSDDPFPTGSIKNSGHTYKGFLSSGKAVYDGTSLSSWSQAIPDDQRQPALPDTTRSPSPVDHLAAQFLDVERMLNMATQPDTTFVNDPAVLGSPMVPQPVQLSPVIFRSPSGRHLRAPPDVPADLNSRSGSTYSTVSTNTFRGYSAVTRTVTESCSLRSPTAPLLIRERATNVGLPSSPRDRHKANVWRVTLNQSNTSITECYGGIE